MKQAVVKFTIEKFRERFGDKTGHLRVFLKSGAVIQVEFYPAIMPLTLDEASGCLEVADETDIWNFVDCADIERIETQYRDLEE